MIDSQAAVDDLIDSGDLRDEVQTLLTLLLLQLERDTTDWATLDTLHQVGDVAGNFVADLLGRDFSDFFADTLVGGEVSGQFGIVLLDNDSSGTLDGFGSDETLDTQTHL